MSSSSQERMSSRRATLSPSTNSFLVHSKSVASSVVDSRVISSGGSSGIRLFCLSFARLFTDWLTFFFCGKCSLGFRWGWSSSSLFTTVESVVIEEVEEFRHDTMREVKAAREFGGAASSDVSNTTGRSPCTTSRLSSEDLKAVQSGNAVYALYCWLRGVVGYIACVVYLLSLWPFVSQYRIAAFFTRSATFILSEIACVFIGKSYLLMWEHKVAKYPFSNRVPFVTSHYMFFFLAEIIFWQVSAPPFLGFLPLHFERLRFILESLDYIVFLRLYAVVLYYHYVSLGTPSFCCLLSYLTRKGGEKIDTFFFLRTTLYYHRLLVLPFLCIWWWVTIGFLFCKCGLSDGSVGNGLWLAFQTISSLNYSGVVLYSTDFNQWVLWMAWLGTAVIRGYLMVVVLWFPLVLSSTSYSRSTSVGGTKVGRREACTANVEVLAECYQLSYLVRDASAKVIQAAWRLHRVRRCSTGGEELRRRWGGEGPSSLIGSNVQQLFSPLKRGMYRTKETVLVLKLVQRLRNLQVRRRALFVSANQLFIPIEELLKTVKKGKCRSRGKVHHSTPGEPFSTAVDNSEVRTPSKKRRESMRRRESTINLEDALIQVRAALNSESMEYSTRQVFEAVETSLLSIISRDDYCGATSVATPRAATPQSFFPSSAEEFGSITPRSPLTAPVASQYSDVPPSRVEKKTKEIMKLLQRIRCLEEH